MCFAAMSFFIFRALVMVVFGVPPPLPSCLILDWDREGLGCTRLLFCGTKRRGGRDVYKRLFSNFSTGFTLILSGSGEEVICVICFACLLFGRYSIDYLVVQITRMLQKSSHSDTRVHSFREVGPCSRPHLRKKNVS